MAHILLCLGGKYSEYSRLPHKRHKISKNEEIRKNVASSVTHWTLQHMQWVTTQQNISSQNQTTIMCVLSNSVFITTNFPKCGILLLYCILSAFCIHPTNRWWGNPVKHHFLPRSISATCLGVTLILSFYDQGITSKTVLAPQLNFWFQKAHCSFWFLQQVAIRPHVFVLLCF